ncbi:hypothetical protein ABL78_2047 [Leptomonas seymouri]|uniref:J domain-containing protein n=1 Tax=Leptomonas seymouri TaxID=5684 RepID=A0A0N1ILU4_LEPSE|nr:hypothetical protein ABL78_2047 [Leptomonas seymouri]|eukprot:KPI88853.1 hypothetical protein ABL78_2047 [Leptomonas seymouri]
MPPKTIPPHYECLGVDPSISDADLSRHYKKLSLQLHPDRAAYRNDGANEVHVQMRYQRVTEAYAVLSDPEKRNAYDTRHGVNFQSRLVRLQRVIGQHNTSTVLRSSTATTVSTATFATVGEEAGATDCAACISPSRRGEARQERSDATVKRSVEGEEEEDDDEDYVPTAVAAAEVGSHPPGSSIRLGDRREKRPSEGESDDYEDSDEAQWADEVQRRLFVERRTTSCGAGCTDDGVPITQYRGVTLTRTRSLRNSDSLNNNHNTDSQWGLVLDGNTVLGLQDRVPEVNAGSAVEGLAEIIFPSVVQQVNDMMVPAGTDVSGLLSSITSTIDEAPDVANLTPTLTTTAHGCTEVEKLQLALAFCTEAFDLVGDTHLLCDDVFLHYVVPDWCVAAEMPALMPGVCVLSVCDTPVHSAEELRQALRAATHVPSSLLLLSPMRSEGDVGATTKRPRTTRSIALECCCLPFT